MFWLIYVTVNSQNVLLWLNAGMETSAPLINAIVNNVLFHSNSHINQMLPQIVHTLCSFWYTRCPRFCNEIYFGQDCSVARNLEVHMVCYITALSVRRQRMMHRISGLTELAEKITTSRIYQK